VSRDLGGRAQLDTVSNQCFCLQHMRYSVPFAEVSMIHGSRVWFLAVLAVLILTHAAFLLRSTPRAGAADGLSLPAGAANERYDFESADLKGWQVVDGRWAVEDVAGAPSGQRALVQRETKKSYDVVVAPGGPYGDVDAIVRFKPMSGREDASGGIVFRFQDGRYYVVRANALEDNFRLYYYDRGRRQLASARVTPPALGQWHTIRVVAVGDRIQASLNDALLIDHRDMRFRAGRVGLWTKADAVTAFDDLVIKGTTP
jgi:hypothetical protein